MSLAERQLAMLEQMAALDPAPFFMGGFAEDAILAGAVTRPHEDFDWILPRGEHDLREAQARELGFGGFETWGEAAPGVPFYVYAENGDLRLDLGILDEVDGRPVVKVHKLFFDVDGAEPPAGYQIDMPTDLFDHPAVEIEGIPIRVVSPLALYQLRVGIAGRGSFGELTPKQQSATQALRRRFFADRSDAELDPRIGPLT